MPKRTRTGRRTKILRAVTYQRGNVGQATSVGASAVSLQLPAYSAYRPASLFLEVVPTGAACVVQVQTFEGSSSNAALWSSTRLVAASSRQSYRYSWPTGDWFTGSERSQNIVEIDNPCLNMEVERSFTYLMRVTWEYQAPVIPDTCPSLVDGVPYALPL